MKLWLKRYQIVSICLSLAIVSLAFVIGSEKEYRAVFTVIVFFLGTLLYLVGSVREWVRNRMTACVLEAVLAVCMLTGAVLSLVRLLS